MANKLLLHMDGALVDRSPNSMSVTGSANFVAAGLDTSTSSFSASYLHSGNFTVSFFATVNSSGTEASPNTLFNFGDFPLKVGISSSDELVITFRNYKWKLPSGYGFSYASKNHYSLMMDVSSSGGSRLFVNGSYITPSYIPTASEISTASVGKGFGAVSLGTGGSYYIKEFRMDDGFLNTFETQKTRFKAGFNGNLTDSSSFANTSIYTAQSGSASASFAPYLSATITFSPAPASGTFKLTYGGNSTANINWNDSAATIQTKLRAVYRMEDALVSGSISGGLSIACGYMGTGLTATSNALQKSGGGAVTISVSESSDTSNRAWTSVTLNNNIGKILYSGFMLGGYDDYTIEMKTKLLPISSPSERTYYKLLNIGNDVNNNFALTLLYNTTTYSAGSFRITKTINGVATNYDFGSGFSPNKELHLALQMSGSTLTMYVNGVSQGTYTFTSSDFFFQHGLTLNPDYSFNGIINDMRIVNYAVYSGDFSSDRTKSLDNSNYSDIAVKTFTFPVTSLSTPSNAIDQGLVLANNGAGYPASYPTGVNDPGVSILYYGNGNTSGSAPTHASYNFGDVATIMSDNGMLRTHYSFSKWNTASNGSGTDYSSGDTITLQLLPLSLYAVWVEDPKYTVTYYANGGQNAPTDSATYYSGASATVLSAGSLSRSNYTFSGWNTAANGSGTSYSAGSSLNFSSSNISLYAVWTENPKYTVTYYVNTGSGIAPVDSNTYYQNDSVSVASSSGLSKNHYSFFNWNTAANGTGTSYNAGGSFPMGSGNVSLYAIWTENPKYNVAYNTQGSPDSIAAVQYYAGDSITVASAVAKTDYTFSGWATAANYPTSGTLYQAGDSFTMPSSGVTLYAYWTAVPKYNIYYSANGGSGSVTDSSQYQQNASVTIASDTGVSRSNYTFSEWNTAANGSGTSYSVGDVISMPGSDLTLYAIWDEILYTVTYNANSGTGTVTDSNSYSYESSATVKSITGITRSGYDFVNWNTAADGSGTSYSAGSNLIVNSNITLYAQWVKFYKISYNANGGHGTTVDNNHYLMGEYATISNPADIDVYYTGKHFYTWNTAADGSGYDVSAGATIQFGALFYGSYSINSDITLYAIWGNADITNTSLLFNFDDPAFILNQYNKNNTGVSIQANEQGEISQTSRVNASYNFTAMGHTGNGSLLGKEVQISASTENAVKDIFSLTPDQFGNPGDFQVEWYARTAVFSYYPIFDFLVTHQDNSTFRITIWIDQAQENNRTSGSFLVREGYLNYKIDVKYSDNTHDRLQWDLYQPTNDDVPFDTEWGRFRFKKFGNYITFIPPIGKPLTINASHALNLHNSGWNGSDWYSQYSSIVMRIGGTSQQVDDIQISKLLDNSFYSLSFDTSTISETISLSNFALAYPEISDPQVGDVLSSSKEFLNGGLIVQVNNDSVVVNKGSKTISNISPINIAKIKVGDFLFGDGIFTNTSVVEIGSNYVVLDTATQPNSSVGGGSNTVSSFGVTLSQDNSISTYSILYNSNGGSGSVTDSNYYPYYSNATIKPSTNISKTGYTFVNWNTAANGSGVNYYENQVIKMPNSNLTLYAVWTEGEQVPANSLQVKKKFINNKNIDETKFLFNNDSYFVTKKADGTEKNVFKVNAQNLIEFADEIIAPAATSNENMINKGQLTSAVAVEQSRATAAEGQLTSDLAAEVSRAQAAEASVASAASAAIAAEASRAMAAEVSVSSSIAAEQSRATAAEGSLQSQINALDSGSSAAVAAEQSRAMAAEGSISAAVAAEASRAGAAEASVSASIAAEQSRAMAAEGSIQSQIDSIISNTDPAALDSLTEIVTAFQNADADTTTAINNLSSTAAANLAAEESRAMAAEGSISAAVAAEESRAMVAEGSISAAVVAEESRAMAAEGQLSSDLAAEVSRAGAAEGSISAAVAAEASRAQAAEGSLSAAIAAEASRAGAAEGSLSVAVAAEVSRATAAEGQLTSDLAAEASRAMAAEGSLSAAVAAEQSRAMAAEGSLSAAVAAEESRAMAAEGQLTSDLAAEVSRATAAEGSLQSQISSIVSNNDPAMLDSLTEIVAAFQAADGNLDTTISNLSATVAANIAAEESRAIAAEGSLSSDLAAEESRAMAAEGSLDGRLDVLEAIVNEKEKFVLTSQDIANGYVDLAHIAIVKSTLITADRLPIHEGEDYTISVVSGKTRITFIGSMIGSGFEALVEGDSVLVEYFY